MLLNFRKGSTRNTKAYVINIFSITAFISGEFRLKNTWGPTTGKHIHEMGCSDFEVLESEEFEGLLDRSLIASVIENIGEETFKIEIARRVHKKLRCEGD